MPPRIGIARSGCRYPLRTTTPTGVVAVERRAVDPRRSLRHLGPSALAVSTALLPGSGRRLRRRAQARRRSEAHPARRARRDRDRGRGIRGTAPVLSVSERRTMSRTLLVVALRFPRRLRGIVQVGLSRRSAPRRRISSPAFSPTAPARAGKPTRVSFVIRQPDGQPLTRFRRGAGPHTGVHLIIVRETSRRSSTAIRRSRRTGRSATRSRSRSPARTASSSTPTRTCPGRSGTSSCSARSRSRGSTQPQTLPPFSATQTVDGYRFTLHGRPNLHAIQAGVPEVHGHRPAGKAGAVHALVRRARARDLLPRRARSTTSTRTSARPAPADARASSAERR